MQTLARAVDYMHQRGILHRDLKPSNVVLTADGTPKITDFGLAKMIDDEVGPTRTDAWLGTPSYMAPEQASGGTKRVGAAADVYSLGAILYELLTGHPPFEGPTSLAILERVRNQPAVPPRRSSKGISLDLETICLKCLEKDPARRYSSAAALAGDLDSFLEGRAIEARPVPFWQRFWRSARRHPAIAGWGLAAVASVTLTLTAWSYFLTSGQLKLHQAEANYQKFVEQRNAALLHGLLSPEEGSLFLGTDASANVKAAEASARQALELAGFGLRADSKIETSRFPSAREAAVSADCYGLLLLSSSVRAQRPLAGESEKARFAAGLDMLERSRQLGGPTRAYFLRRANLLEHLGRAREAKEAGTEAEIHPPAGADDYFLVGEEHYRRGRWQEATSAFDHALAREPSHFWAQFFLSVCHLKMQQWEAARMGLNACLAQQPNFAWAYVFRSFAHEKLHATAEAEADFQNALRLNPDDDVRYVVYVTRGILLFNLGDLTKAAENFRRAVSLKSGQYNAYLNLAQVELAAGRFDAAARQMDLAIKRKAPRQAVAGYHLERGRRLFVAARFRESLDASSAARELSPGDPLPDELCARALLSMERYELAERSFTRYLQKGGPKKSDIFRARGLARMKLGKFSEAVDDYTRALELALDAEIYQHRGWAHFFADAWKLALRDFSAAILLDPTSADAFAGRGLAQVMLGHYREAVMDAETSIRRDPRTPEMMHNVACILAQAAARAEADSHQPDRQTLADSYRRRAVHAVHETLARVEPRYRAAFLMQKVVPDAALDPIHNDADFKMLQGRYRKL